MPEDESDELVRGTGHTAQPSGSTSIGADCAGSYDTATWQQGGYEADSWDSGPDYLPVQRRKPSPLRTLVATLVVLLVLALVGVGAVGLWRGFAAKTTAMEVGSCITATRDGQEWTTQRVDCDAAQVSYTIVSKVDGDGSCDQPYTPFQYLDDGGSTARRTYCLMENLRKDVCYSPGPDDQVVPVACTDASARAKVAERLDGVADQAKCPSGTQPLVFGQAPQRTYCLTTPAA